jgi:radical SAM superfamily enzyme YgiQ (UPF0313 family)
VNLTLPYLAALAPKGWEIKLVDELLQDIDFDERVDLVAISTWTQMSLRAYDIAAEFRKRRVPVIMGGPHIHFHSEEALGHCDAVGVGEGEEIWPQMLNDAAAGRLKSTYRTEPLKSLAGLPFPSYDLLDLKPYGLFKTFSVQFSRGCPFKCEFCSERFYLGDQYRTRPVEEVVEEVKHCGSKLIFFADSNFAGKPAKAMELMEALIPLKIRWSTLWTSNLCLDTRFLDLAVRSGILHVNIGLESIETQTLQGMNKRFNKVQRYEEMLANMRNRGISYSLNFVFGWDGESPDVFRSTFDFLHQQKVPVAYFNILMPDKGTPLYDRMKSENRLVSIEDLGRYPGQACLIKPDRYTAEELESNVGNMYREFYSFRSMLSRLPIPLSKSSLASWSINFTQRRMARSGMSENNFEAY